MFSTLKNGYVIQFYGDYKVNMEKLDHRYSISEPPHDKTNKMTCAPSEDSNQPGHAPSLIRVFAVRSMGS